MHRGAYQFMILDYVFFDLLASLHSQRVANDEDFQD